MDTDIVYITSRAKNQTKSNQLGYCAHNMSPVVALQFLLLLQLLLLSNVQVTF